MSTFQEIADSSTFILKLVNPKFKIYPQINKKVLIQGSAIFILVVSVLVIIGWLFKIRMLLSIVPGAPTMKFNTALSFLIVGSIIFLYLKKKKSSMVITLLSILLCSVSIFTLFPYFFELRFNIDNLIVSDRYSRKFPGRMSIATTICFLVFSTASLGKLSKVKSFQKISDLLVLGIGIVSLQVIVTYILQILAKSSVLVFNSMAIHTAILFLLISIAFSAMSSKGGYTYLLYENHTGSKLARTLVPFVIMLPICLSFLLLFVLNNEWITTDVSISLYTIAYTVLSLLYLYHLTNRLNKADIKKKQLESSLYNTNQELMQFKYALDKSSIVMINDPRGIIEYVNDKFCEISKFTREEILGKSEKVLRSGHHSKNFHRKMYETISNGEVWLGGVKKMDKYGVYYWVQTAVIPFKNKSGDIYQYLTIGQDITRHKWLSSQYENLKLKTKEMEQFTYIASHDLQEPLRTVKGMSNILQQEYSNKLDKDGNACLEYITSATDRMSHLIKALLDYSRIGIHQKREKIDCNEVIDIVCKDLAIIIKETKTVITVDPLPTLLVYPMEFRLLLQNLVSNAIKFRQENKTPKIHIGSEKKDKTILFSVKDNGIGIEKKHKRIIFAIFKRLHSLDEFEGTGIGLAHSEKIVHLHGGEIWVDSKLGEGSTFYFTIPLI